MTNSDAASVGELSAGYACSTEAPAGVEIGPPNFSPGRLPL
jgi:hypothetical protein